MTKARPFMKYSSRSRTMWQDIASFVPKNIENYYETFLGGGGLFFRIHERINKAYLSSPSSDVCESYIAVKDHLDELILVLQKHATNHNKAYFYHMRAQKRTDNPIENAARFIYLMRACYNGIFRTNRHQEINSSVGSRINLDVCPIKKLTLASQALQKATIIQRDFWQIEPSKGDFVYFDPPAYPLPQQHSLQYHTTRFAEDEHLILRDFAVYLDEKWVSVMISNSLTGFINEIYSNMRDCRHFEIHKIPTLKLRRMLKTDDSINRIPKELLITNFIV